MSASDVRNVSPVVLLASVSAANTAAATGEWIDVRGYEGDVCAVQNIGAVTGSIDGKIQDATDISGTGVADLSGAVFASATAAGVQKITFRATETRGFIRYIGTIVTGPSLASSTLLARRDTV